MPRSQYDNTGSAVLGAFSGGLRRILEAVGQKRQAEAAAAEKAADRKQEWGMFREGNALKLDMKNMDITSSWKEMIARLNHATGIQDDKQTHEFSMADKKHGQSKDLAGHKSTLRKDETEFSARLNSDLDQAAIILKDALNSLGKARDVEHGFDLDPDLAKFWQRNPRGYKKSVFDDNIKLIEQLRSGK